MLSKNVLTYFCLFAIILVGHYGERIVPGEVQVEENLSRVFRCAGVIINLDYQLDRI